MILICTNELAGTTGHHKSVVELANGLHRAGYPIAILSFLGAADGSDRALPQWPLDTGVPAYVLQTLAADGGRLLHRNYHPVFTVRLGDSAFGFTANHLAALRQIDSALSEEDTILFTAPIPAYVFNHALEGRRHRAKTILQIHNDYRSNEALREMLNASRPSIDRLQTVSDGQRAQFVPLFDDNDVVFVPNFPGERREPVEATAHVGINIALPASFQHRKNQLDAVRALALIEDESVHLTLWGNINRVNPYYIAVRQLVTDLGLVDRVRFPGFGSEADVYSTADIVLMTSLSEGFPYPLIEAMYQGRPTVSYDFEHGPREAIDEGESGYIVPVGDVEQLAERLARLASDDALRARQGRHARELFDARFSSDVIVERYRRFLGSEGRTVDLVKTFATAGGDPVDIGALSHDVRDEGDRTLHRVTVRSDVRLHDVRIDDGVREVSPKLTRLRKGTRIEFHSEGNDLISYVTKPGSPDRHYLADIDHGELEVLPYLRRTASYGDGTPPVSDTIFAASDGTRRLTRRERWELSTALTRNISSDVVWKLRQMVGLTRRRRTERPSGASLPIEQSEVAGTTAASTGAAEQQRARREQFVAPATPAGASQPRAGRIRGVVGKYRAEMTAQALAIPMDPSAVTRFEIARHPWFPITSGVDNFGSPINRPGGVAVANDGSVARPTVSISGEYDWVLLRDGAGERRIEPYGYGELFERICSVERSRGLFDIATRDGVHPWELGRASLISQIAEALGMWGRANAAAAPVKDVYQGTKRLTTAPMTRRVMFDDPKSGQRSSSIEACRDDKTLVIVHPTPSGYPEMDGADLVYPMHQFSSWRRNPSRRVARLHVGDVDVRPFEEALTEALGIRVDLGNHLRSAMLVFLDQRDFWTPVFERIQPEEVLVSSGLSLPGVKSAARRAGAAVSDIQCADTGRYHAWSWSGGTPHYGATRLYAWSEYWAARTNVYTENVIAPRPLAEFTTELSGESDDKLWDVCVVAQPGVQRRILAFVERLVRERENLKVVIAQDACAGQDLQRALAEAGLTDKVSVSQADPVMTVKRSAICVGGFSLSLWEAAALGCPTYVIPVPGHELALDDIQSGLFRLAGSPHDLVPYEVPESRRSIFATP